MASTYEITDGDGILLLDITDASESDIIGCYVVSDSALDDVVTITMGQSVDNGVTISVLPEVFEDGTNQIDAGENSNIMQTLSYVKGSVYLIIEVGSATVGTLTIDSFGK